jgi:hypothetical protein
MKSKPMYGERCLMVLENNCEPWQDNAICSAILYSWSFLCVGMVQFSGRRDHRPLDIPPRHRQVNI